MYIYARKNGEVVLRSEEKQDLPQFIEKKLIPTKKQKEEITKNKRMRLVDGKLEFREQNGKKQSVEELIDLTKKAKDLDDIKSIIINHFLDK